MEKITRKAFLSRLGIMGTSLTLLNGCGYWPEWRQQAGTEGVTIESIKKGEDVFEYVNRVAKRWDLSLYRQIIGAANDFKEGDQAIGVAAANASSRQNARMLLANTKVGSLMSQSLYSDAIYDFIHATSHIGKYTAMEGWTMGRLKEFILSAPEAEIKTMMPGLTSDVIGCVVKLMNNEELISVGQKVFNPLPGSQIGSKGYMGARIQPNSPTDNIEDIRWQVFNAWSYAVGDLVLGTNPVSSAPKSVAKVEAALKDILDTFGLQDTLPNCVLAHIDVQAEVEAFQPGSTGIWFQSLAGTVAANQTFDVTIEKMRKHVAARTGRYGLYAETGQGADFTNGHGAGFDMLIHESRKYGFLRALKMEIDTQRGSEPKPWVHVNDVAGFIGPEVFKTKEQLVRCCLEDTVMGKLHGLTIGLDICSTLHMDVTLDDLSWCIDQVMPANPAYLMALPTKNDPMLSYLTTSFADHVRVREKFGYKTNEAMWAFYKELGVIGQDGQPTEKFGDPIWVYAQYCKAKGDERPLNEVYEAGKKQIAAVRERGVPIAEGYGQHTWDLPPALEKQVNHLYEDAKKSLWTPMEEAFISTIPAALLVDTTSKDKKDYIYHPETGEKLSKKALQALQQLKADWKGHSPDVQVVISDGLNARALMDEGHLPPFLDALRNGFSKKGLTVSAKNVVIRHGRVRAGYACGEILFGPGNAAEAPKAVVHIIGERPGSGHHNFSAYLTVAPVATWSNPGAVDHDITRVVSGISDSALTPNEAANGCVDILSGLLAKYV